MCLRTRSNRNVLDEAYYNVYVGLEENGESFDGEVGPILPTDSTERLELRRSNNNVLQMWA